MRILLTGSTGFLGSNLLKALSKLPHEVFCFKRDTKMREVKKFKPEIIYHCACIACEGLSVFSPALITRNTFQNTIGILSPAINHKVRRFIYCSSMARYGKQRPPFTEDMEPMPHDPYAISKVSSEKMIKMMAETHGIEYVIAIPHNIIGPGQKYDDPFRNVASIMINRMLQGKQPIIYGDGEQTRIFSFIDDCIGPLLRMLDCPSGEIYNIGPDNRDAAVVTINRLASTIAFLLSFNLKPIYMPERPREVREAYCSSDKIRKSFGYKTKTNLEDGLREMIKDIEKRGIKPFNYHLPIEIKDGCPKSWIDKLM